MGWGMRAWWGMWVVGFLVTPASPFFMAGGGEEPGANRDVVQALTRMAQAMEGQERHTALYERVALLEQTLSRRAQTEAALEAQVQQLRVKIPALEEEIETIPDMRKELGEFEVKIEKLVHDYEAKLSALASEVIRLKKRGQRHKNLQTLGDGIGVLLRTAPVCPEVGQGMVGERVGEQCLYFSLTSHLNWTSAHHHCQTLGGDLAAPQDLRPLKAFLHRAFTRGPSLWLGASYDLDPGNPGTFDVAANESMAFPSTLADIVEDGSIISHETGETGDLPLASTQDDIRVNDQPIISTHDSESDDNLHIHDTRQNGFPSIRSLHSTWQNRGPSVRSLQRAGQNSVLQSSVTSGSLQDNPAISPPMPNLREGLPPSLDMLSNEDVRQLGGAGNIRLRLDRAPKFGEDPIMVYGNMRVANTRIRHGRNLGDNEVAPDLSEDGARENEVDPSIVDVILLSKTSRDSLLVADDAQVHSNTVETSETVPGASTELGNEDLEDDQSISNVSDSPGLEDTRGQQEARKATMHCMLLQQRESLDYELIGKPCDEIHNFVCDLKFTFDNLLRD